MTAGQPRPHDSARLHVTGAAGYVDDLAVPATTLHLAFGLSDVAAGDLVALDLDPVRAAPGVVRVLAAGDLPGANDISPSPLFHEELLASAQVHYLGQPLFIVAAGSHHGARRAARLARVTVAPRPPILTVDQAFAHDARFEDPLVWGRGDARAAIAAAPHRLEGQIDFGGQEHFYLEGQVALAHPTEEGVTLQVSSQHPTEIQHKVAEALNLPMHAVRVEVRRMGGAFGGKESQANALAIACAVMARATGRPCKMRYDRDDDFVITGKRHDGRIGYHVGFDDQGRILGLDVVHYIRCGWSLDLSLPVGDRAMLHVDNAYFLPAVRITSHRLRTNTQSATAFRGFGGPQGVLGTERVIDHIAHALGRDPLEVRRVNAYRTPTPERAPQTTPYGQPITDFRLNDIMADLARRSEYHARRAAIAAFNAANPVLKRGIALSPVKFGISFTLTHLNQAGALVHVYQDGSVLLNHGGTEMGQGLHQKIVQIAAAEFGLPEGLVRITATDTGKVPNTSATAASSGTDLNGMAVAAACDTIRTRVAAFWADRHQADPAAVRFADGAVHLDGQATPWAEVIHAAWAARVPLSATGFYATPDLDWDRKRGQGRPFYYFAEGAAVTEVVIDTLSGEYRLLRADIVHDCGSSLNPALDRGQIEGGYVQGVGWLTTEELVWDETGRLRTHAPSTYKIPACSDRPDVLNITLWDRPNERPTIRRSKAVGEPPFMLGISAFLALSDAVAAVGPGYPALDAPATPERILAAVQRLRA